MRQPHRVIWVISDGRRGIENQALGLAEAIGRIRPVKIIRKIIGSDPNFAKLPPSLQQLRRPKASRYGLDAPFPDIVIGCGRQAITPLRLIKKTHPQSYVIYIQDPKRSYRHFDLIIAPEHDGLNRANSIAMIGSPNRLTPALLDEAAQGFKAQINAFPAPRAALLIGGPSKRQHTNPDIIAAHIRAAESLIDKGNALFITLSRRTDEDSRHAWRSLKARYKTKIWLYDAAQDGHALNPYFAFLAAADIIAVTEDSTNMLTDGCITGRPVYRLPMAGAPGKFKQLYSTLAARCHVMTLTALTPPTPYAPLDETGRIAKITHDLYERYRADING